jgi:hypothetical protein
MFKRVQVASVFLCITSITTPIHAWADIDPITGQISGDASAQTFAQYCRGDLSPERTKRFYAELEKAERAANGGELVDAEAALGIAWEAAYRGDAFNDNGIRCFGEQVTRRWLAVNIALWRRGAGVGPEGIGGDYTGMYVVAADRGTDGIVASVSAQPARQFRRSLNGLEGIISVNDGRRDFGALVLPEEDDVANASRAAIDLLREQAEKNHERALASEEKAFNRAATNQELAVGDAMGDMGTFASAMAGVETDTVMAKEAIIISARVQESQEFLREARDWNLEVNDSYPLQSLPSSQRAKKRGNLMLSKANDSQFSLSARDSFYRDAEQYFDFGGYDDQATTAASGRESMQPALQAERDRQEAVLEKTAAEWEGKREDMQKAVDDMQKSEAEQQSFKDEADALEAELGF